MPRSFVIFVHRQRRNSLTRMTICQFSRFPAQHSVFSRWVPLCFKKIRFKGMDLLRGMSHLQSVSVLHIHEVHMGMQISYHEFRDACQNLNGLSSLILSGGDIVSDWPETAPTINFPSLQMLHISAHPDRISSDISGMLINIQAPKLQSLEIGNIYDGELAAFFDHQESSDNKR